ncbi:MAG: hypothetical protein IJH39_12155 [Clostridia bacterium]|nr:hypothetical protein [Clostridia bacterium]
MNILTKEILKTFSYTTANGNREGSILVKMNGRDYIKFGTFQAVTLVGDLCEVYDADVKRLKTVLFVGVSKQHPRDIKIDKELAYEVAHLNALFNPQMIIEVGEYFTQYNFREFAKNYVDTLKLQFVKTVQEKDEDDLLSAIGEIEFEEDPNICN